MWNSRIELKIGEVHEFICLFRVITNVEEAFCMSLLVVQCSISALHCGHEVGGGGDQESPIHKSEQVVTLGGKQVLNSILITTIKWPGRQFICHRKDSNVGDWLRASTRKRKGWRKTWTFFYKKMQRKQSRNEGEHNIRKKTDLSSSWSSGVLRCSNPEHIVFSNASVFSKMHILKFQRCHYTKSEDVNIYCFRQENWILVVKWCLTIYNIIIIMVDRLLLPAQFYMNFILLLIYFRTN